MPEVLAANRPTSLALLEQTVRHFLSTPDPEVICISGHWGVGKTYAWKRFLRDAAPNIELKRYSYVSLFGVNSLEELKYSIFENSVQSSSPECEPSLKTLKSNTAAIAKHFGKKSLWFVQQLPKVKSYVGGLGPLWFLTVKETIVCFDDIERHGKDLRLADILGLISALKEEKRCKIVVILNDEALENEKDKPEFDKYLEKVVDIFLRFRPTAEECARIALSADDPITVALKESCVSLGISNIRVIRKLERAARQIEPLIKDYDPQVLNNTVRSLALLGWTVYEPLVAPSLDYLERRAEDMFVSNTKQPPSEKEAAWDKLLEALGFSFMDDYDRVLLDGVRNGFPDPDALRQYAAEQDKQARMHKSEASWKEAWAKYRDSFENNQPEVVAAIYQGFMSEIQHMGHLDLNGAVSVLKSLQAPEKAAELIQAYMARPGWTRSSFDLKAHPFANRIDDPDVIRAINDKYAALNNNDDREPSAVLIDVVKRHGWSPEDLSSIATMTTEDYYKLFKSLHGSELRSVIEGCLRGRTIFSGSEPMGEIASKATEALERIGRESTINALRVKQFGVDISNLSPSTAPATPDNNSTSPEPPSAP